MPLIISTTQASQCIYFITIHITIKFHVYGADNLACWAPNFLNQQHICVTQVR